MIAITDHNFGTFEERLEKFKSWQDHLPNFIKKGIRTNKTNNIIAVRERHLGDVSGFKKQYFYTHNIVTVDGNAFYAKQGGGLTPAVTFLDANNRCELQNPASAPTPANTDVYSNVSNPITASRKAITATYPLVSDPDADNTGAGGTILSWDYSWLTTDFNTASANNIYGGCVHDAGGSPVSGSKLLTHWAFATSFEKLATDKLKIFVNHQFLGV